MALTLVPLHMPLSMPCLCYVSCAHTYALSCALGCVHVYAPLVPVHMPWLCHIYCARAYVPTCAPTNAYVCVPAYIPAFRVPVYAPAYD